MTMPCEIELSPLLSTEPAGPPALGAALPFLGAVKVALEVRVGRAEATLGGLLALRLGEVLALDRRVEQPLDVLIDGHVVARGTLVAVGEHFGLRLTQTPSTMTAAPAAEAEEGTSTAIAIATGRGTGTRTETATATETAPATGTGTGTATSPATGTRTATQTVTGTGTATGTGTGIGKPAATPAIESTGPGMARPAPAAQHATGLGTAEHRRSGYATVEPGAAARGTAGQGAAEPGTRPATHASSTD